MPPHEDVRARRAGWCVARGLGLAALAAIAWMVGCYKPAIVDGGFLCGAAQECPDGMTCVVDHCYLKGSTKIPTDAAPDVHDASPVEVTPMCEPKTTPTGACVVKSDLACDPVCQTGCCPDQKCSALNVPADGTMAATLGCSPTTATRKFGETCDPSNAGTPTRSDNCEAGLACVDGDVGAICLKVCRGDGDCTDGTRCEQRKLDAQGTAMVSVCGLPPTSCTPLGTNSGCPAQRVCYLVDTNAIDGDRTICDISAGQGKQTSCRYARDCYPGFTCATTGIGIGRCWPVCTLPGGTCPGITTCQDVGKTYGYCD